MARDLSRDLKRRYVIGLSLIAFLILGVYGSVNWLVLDQTVHSQIIDLAGRQRMLSQRTALLVLDLTRPLEATRRAQINADLQDAVERMELEHRALSLRDGTLGLKHPLSAEMRDLYFGGRTNLDAKIGEYVSELKTILSFAGAVPETQADTLVAQAEGPLLDDLETVVVRYKEEAWNDTWHLIFLKTACFVLTLIVLVAEAVLIFQPMVSRIRNGTQALANSRADLEYMSMHDGLTGLANRASLRQKLDEMTEGERQLGMTAAVMQLDLDHFKHINDSLGHAAGDELLKSVARRIEALLGPKDLAVRLGGDEFAILMMEGASKEKAVLLGEQIIESLQQPFVIQGAEVFSGGSVGITIYPDDGRHGNELMKNADMALYEAKRMGRGLVALYSRVLRQQQEMRHVVEHELRRALELSELTIHYQPMVSLVNGQCVGVEALVRWLHPMYGLISPVKFVSVAEEAGLGRQLTEFVITKAFETFREWKEHNIAPQALAINLSAGALRDSHFTYFLPTMAEKYGLEPSRVILEITENTLLGRGGELAVETLNMLHAKGFQISLDDFGTGYASLTHLKSLPISQVKIDREFISSIEDDPENEAIVRSIVDLVHLLRLDLLAEGVENVAQARMLQNLGCKQAQGFFFARPMESVQFADWFAQQAASELASIMSKVGLSKRASDSVKDASPAKISAAS